VHYAAAPLQSEREALIAAIRAAKNPTFAPGPSVKIKPRDEPDWLSKSTLIKISTNLQFSHETTLIGALSIQTSFFPQAITARNFFAHRARESEDKVRRLGVSSYSHSIHHTVELINVVLPGRTDTLLNEWIAEVKLIGGAMCG
jgi:hypothetical protein